MSGSGFNQVIGGPDCPCHKQEDYRIEYTCKDCGGTFKALPFHGDDKIGSKDITCFKCMIKKIKESSRESDYWR